MPIHAVCPSCNFPYVLGDEFAGTLFTCTQCEAQLKLPEPPARPLPPIDPATYDRVAGTKWPLFLSLLGLDAIHESFEQGATATLWACRHLFLLLVTGIFLFVYATSTESAVAAGPLFFLVSLCLLVFSYITAVSVAARFFADNEKATGPLADYIVKPVLVFFADPEAALPALRVLFFTFILSLGTLLLGLRAGSIASVIPTLDFHFNAPQPSYADSVPSPRPTATTPFNPTGAPETPATAPSVARAATHTAPPPAPVETPTPPTAIATQGPPPPPEE